MKKLKSNYQSYLLAFYGPVSKPVQKLFRSKYRKPSLEELEEIKRLRFEGRTFSYIGENLDFGTKRVARIAKPFPWGRSKKYLRDQEIIKALEKGDLSHRQIAKEFGLSGQRVDQIAKRAGIEAVFWPVKSGKIQQKGWSKQRR